MNLIRSLNPMQIKHGRWRRFYRKYHLSMRRAIVENVVRMLSCGRKIRGVSLYQCPHSAKYEAGAFYLQEPVLLFLREKTY